MSQRVTERRHRRNHSPSFSSRCCSKISSRLSTSSRIFADLVCAVHLTVAPGTKTFTDATPCRMSLSSPCATKTDGSALGPDETRGIGSRRVRRSTMRLQKAFPLFKRRSSAEARSSRGEVASGTRPRRARKVRGGSRMKNIEPSLSGPSRVRSVERQGRTRRRAGSERLVRDNPRSGVWKGEERGLESSATPSFKRSSASGSRSGELRRSRATHLPRRRQTLRERYKREDSDEDRGRGSIDPRQKAEANEMT